jgi:hydrogenase maturation factor
VTIGPDQCLTCGDVAIAARVIEIRGLEALVVGSAGRERVAIDLVPDARQGDELLCHAGIALERIEEPPA